jgi:hypothetical protein
LVLRQPLEEDDRQTKIKRNTSYYDESSDPVSRRFGIASFNGARIVVQLARHSVHPFGRETLHIAGIDGSVHPVGAFPGRDAQKIQSPPIFLEVSPSAATVARHTMDKPCRQAMTDTSKKVCENTTRDMNTPLSTDTARISAPAAWMAMASAAAVLILLAGLHVLSPEFDPSFRVVSEYANGRHSWVLSLMFIAWALSSWALVVAIWPQLNGIGGKISLGFLIAAGIGEAMASVFDINHPLHNLSGMIGVLSLPIAAMLISIRLGRSQPWLGAKKALLWTANLTWASLVLMFATLFIMIHGYTLAGNRIVVVGWANRLLVVLYCVWVVTVAIHAIRLQRRG